MSTAPATAAMLSVKHLKELKQQLKGIDDQLKELKITVTNPSDNPHSSRKPIANAIIPNKLFLLWDKKTALQRKLRASVSKHYDLAQSCIGKHLILEKTDSMEKRLKKESSRSVLYYMGGAVCMRWHPGTYILFSYLSMQVP